MIRIGLIYGYRDPISQRWLYVGSVHEQTTLNRRHQQHLKEGKGLLGPWLCNFTNGQELHPDIAKNLLPNLGNHFRWHTSRGVVKDDCVFCFCEKSSQ